MKASPARRPPAATPPIVAQAQSSPDVLTGNVRPVFLDRVFARFAWLLT